MIAPYRALGQTGTVEGPSNIECLEHLELPNYPPLARTGRFQATQTVKVLLSAKATIRSIELTLQGKAYELLDDDFNRSLFAFGPPNQFWVRAGPVYVNPKVTAK